jgi:hypothetical protein
MNSSVRLFAVFFIFIASVLVGCGRPHGRNVYGKPSDERLLSRCETGNGTTVALYVNEGGGAAVGVSYSVSAERKPQLGERQVLYSDYEPEIRAISCSSAGFELTTSIGPLPFNDSEIEALRITPRNLGEEYRRKRGSSPR